MAMAMCKIDRLRIAVHHTSPPTDEQWDRWIALCSEQDGPIRVVVESHGGAPNAKQRRALSDALAGRDLRSAILSDSIVVRGVVTALAWLGVSLRAFPLHDYPSVAAYLGLSNDELTGAIEQLRSLRKDCGLDEVRVAS
jgi:regulator of extracellular matrix RemA (YlzA/DUF370 family)